MAAISKGLPPKASIPTPPLCNDCASLEALFSALKLKDHSPCKPLGAYTITPYNTPLMTDLNTVQNKLRLSGLTPWESTHLPEHLKRVFINNLRECKECSTIRLLRSPPLQEAFRKDPSLPLLAAQEALNHHQIEAFKLIQPYLIELNKHSLTLFLSMLLNKNFADLIHPFIRDPVFPTISISNLVSLLIDAAKNGHACAISHLQSHPAFNNIPPIGTENSSLACVLQAAVKNGHSCIITALRDHPAFNQIPPRTTQECINRLIYGSISYLLWQAVDGSHVSVLVSFATHPSFRQLEIDHLELIFCRLMDKMNLYASSRNHVFTPLQRKKLLILFQLIPGNMQGTFFELHSNLSQNSYSTDDIKKHFPNAPPVTIALVKALVFTLPKMSKIQALNIFYPKRAFPSLNGQLALGRLSRKPRH